MEKLNKAYDAVEMLENLGLPISCELSNGIAKMEREYLCEEIIPLIKQELEPMLERLKNCFNMEVTYTKDDGLEIKLVDTLKSNQSLFPTSDSRGYRKKKYIIRVTFPDKHVSCHNMVSNTFADVVKYAGPMNVEKLGIMMLGKNIVSSTLFENERYAAGQQEVEPGIYVSTYCDTEKKLEILKTINRELKLNLIIEKVMLGD